MDSPRHGQGVNQVQGPCLGGWGSPGRLVREIKAYSCPQGSNKLFHITNVFYIQLHIFNIFDVLIHCDMMKLLEPLQK